MLSSSHRLYRSIGKIDSNGLASIKAALAAGITQVDGYVYPCICCSACGDAQHQMQEVNTLLTQGGVSIDTLWLDIERSDKTCDSTQSCGDWSSDHSINQDFITSLISEGAALGIKMGVYTNKNNWEEIVGSDWTYAASKGLGLWYAHYDNNPSFDDFQAFGGWQTPTIKQYLGDKSSCGVDLDYNWRP